MADGALPEDGAAGQLAEWVRAQMAAEVARLERAGVRILPLRVKNMGVVVEREGPGRPRRVLNRLELDTAFDFAKVVRLLVGPPTPVPAELSTGRGKLVYHNVVLGTTSPVTLLAGYVTEPSLHADNELALWRFVNNRLQAADHRVEFGPPE
jgi:hypothetical protein